jgi:hypothetical protein
MTLTPDEYAACLRRDFSTFLHRSFYDLNPQTPFFPNWHIEVMAAKLEACRLGQCTRLSLNRVLGLAARPQPDRADYQCELWAGPSGQARAGCPWADGE